MRVVVQGSMAMSLLALAACGGGNAPTATSTTPANASGGSSAAPEAKPNLAAATPIPRQRASTSDALVSCAAEIGAAAAAKKVAVCRNVSPATHPPCNAANSCALIDDEIARSCALFDAQGRPMTGCPAQPNGPAGAAAIVRRYYSAINAHDYSTAWAQWGDDGRPGQTYEAFKKGFAHTRSVAVTIGALPPGDAGAGSSYQPVPVTVTATLADGTRQRFTGTYVIRRVNGIDGATPGDLRWHIDSAKLAAVK